MSHLNRIPIAQLQQGIEPTDCCQKFRPLLVQPTFCLPPPPCCIAKVMCNHLSAADWAAAVAFYCNSRRIEEEQREQQMKNVYEVCFLLFFWGQLPTHFAISINAGGEKRCKLRRVIQYAVARPQTPTQAAAHPQARGALSTLD